MITLTKNQKLGVNAILNFINSDEKMFLLKGYAGTGKTTLTRSLVNRLNRYGMDVYFSATTNKAATILYNSLNKDIDNPALETSVSTVHHILNIQKTFNPRTGEEYFVSMLRENIYNAIVVVDECSMVSYDMFNIIDKKIIGDSKIIFIGDSAQIPPVKNKDMAKKSKFTFNSEEEMMLSPVFTFVKNSFTLTEPIRQTEGNPIIEDSTLIRNNLDKATPFIPKTIKTEKGSIMVIREDSALFNKLLKDGFNKKEYKDDVDFIKLVAYKNKTVKYYNKEIRKYMGFTKKYEPGDKMMFMSMYENRLLHTTFPNSSTFTIKKIETGTKRIKPEDYGIQEAAFSVPTLTFNGCIITYGHGAKGPVIALLKKIFEKARRSHRSVRGAIFKKGFMLRDYFADIDYANAITAHKSQGSTYRNTIVMMRDIRENLDIKERNRIMYTAITRSSNNVYLIV